MRFAGFGLLPCKPRRVCALSICLAAFAIAAPASAVTLQGTLASDASAARLYSATCTDDGSGPPLSLTARVRDLAPVGTALVSVQILAGFGATNSTDPIDGDLDASPLVSLNGGGGAYDLFVDKTGIAAEEFELTVQCWTGADGGGVPTGTTLSSNEPRPVPLASFPGTLILLSSLLAVGLACRSKGASHRFGGGGGEASREGGRRLTRLIGLLTLSVAMFCGGARVAAAHDQAGSLGPSASATDFYEITCFDNGFGSPASLAVDILDSSPGAAPHISVQVRRGASLVSISDDLTADIVRSPEIVVNGGAGVYQVLVDKSGAGPKTYTLGYHCYTGPDATGDHTGTSLVARQNQ